MPGRIPVRQGRHFGVSLNRRQLRAVGALTQASYPKLGVAIESLHYAKTGVTEQELDGWSTSKRQVVAVWTQAQMHPMLTK